MKKLFYFFVLITVALLLNSCSKKGAVGPAGATGATGAVGPAGPAGANGTNGSVIYSGTTTPSAGIAAVGDFTLI